MQKSVSIVLLNYNTTSDTIDCIESLSKIHYDNYNIIVVDNKSREEEISKLEIYLKDKQKCKLIKSDENGGFAKGNNLGIRYSQSINSDYVLLLNSDTEVEPDFLGYLVDSIEENPNKVALSIGKIKYFSEKNKIWYGGGAIDWNKCIGLHFGEGEFDKEEYNVKKSISFATGCAILINMSLDIDLELPENYFMYFEDVDYSARMIEAGYEIIYEPKSVIYHKVGASGGGEGSPFTVEWSNRGRLIFMEKYKYKFNPLKFNAIKLKFYITRFIKYILFLIRREPDKASSLYNGIKSGRQYIKNRDDYRFV